MIINIIIALLIAIIFWKSIVAIVETLKKAVNEDKNIGELEKSLANDLVDIIKDGNGNAKTRLKMVLLITIMVPFSITLYLLTKPFRLMLGDERADGIFKRIPTYTKARETEDRCKNDKGSEK